MVAYWRDVLQRDPDELGRWADHVLGEVRARRVRYRMVAGQELDSESRRRLHERLPQAELETWPGCGHFPHLAHPGRFAALLAATGARRASP